MVELDTMTADLGAAFLTIERHNALLTLNRPEKANALNTDLLQAILRAFDIAERSEDTRSIVLHGAGQHFCAGADLSELISDGASSLRKLLHLFREVTRRFEASPLAVVAAVHGAARAGGLEIALACDAVVADENASFGDAHLLRELLPGGGASVRLPRAVGYQRAKWLILSGKSIDAETARQWGVVNSLASSHQLLEMARVTASEFAVGNRATFELAKALIHQSSGLDREGALENEISILEEHIKSESAIRNIKDFINRS